MIREYFSHHNIPVAINPDTISPCYYWVCIGTSAEIEEYLKTIRSYTRLLCIIDARDERATTNLNLPKDAKTIITMLPIEAVEASVIFGFLFTGKDHRLVLRTPPSTPKQVSNTPNPSLSQARTNERSSQPQPQAEVVSGYQLLKERWIKPSNTPTKTDPPTQSTIDDHTKNSRSQSKTIHTTTHRPAKPFRRGAYLLAAGYSSLVLIYFLTFSLFIGTLVLPSRYYQRLPNQLPTRLAQGLISSQGIVTPALWLMGGRSLTRTLQETILLTQDIHKTKRLWFQSQNVLGFSTDTQQTMLTLGKQLSDRIITITALLEPEKQLRLGKLLTNYIHPYLQRARVAALDIANALNIWQAIATRDSYKLVVLLQNNHELRPTGGFIGSVAFITFTKGVPTTMQIEDVYTVDGQLVGHVDPPEPLKRHLHLEHWYLRDANWDPHFPKTAQQALFFIEKSIDHQADGVVAITATLLYDMLRVLGPLPLPDSQVTLTDQNAINLISQHIHQDFFPGDTTKKDMLQEILIALKHKVSTASPTTLLSLATTVHHHLVGKNIQLFSLDQIIRNQIVQAGWGGEWFPVSACANTARCLADMFGLVETNVGVNKSNQHVARSVHRRVTIGDGVVATEDTVTLTNNQPIVEQRGSGTYESYIRVFLPPNSDISTVTINRTPVAQREPTATPSGWYYEATSSAMRTQLDVFLTVKPGESSSLQYITKRVVDIPPSTYDLIIEKQSGIQSFPFSLSITDGRKGGGVSQLAKSVPLEYNTTIARRERFSVSLP